VTTRQALSRFKSNGDPVAGSTDPMSAGNGSLMRLAPVAIRYWKNRAALHDAAALQSRTTHAAPEAVDACVVFADRLADAIEGKQRSEFLGARVVDLSPKIAAIEAGTWRGKRRDDVRSSGYVVHSLEAAFWCVGRTASFKDAVLLAANLGDDADTVAAITGQLAGALYGWSAVPREWLALLAMQGRIIGMADELFSSAARSARA
jgi:ADP-ribosyl-[dinitrogen reductase] hydrolase